MRHRTASDLEFAEFVTPVRAMQTVEGWLFGSTAGTPVDSAVGFAPGAINLDVTNAIPYRNSGTISSSTWASILGASVTLDGAFDNGKIIDGATTEANAMGVGGASDNITFWQEGANDVHISTSAGAVLTIDPLSGLVLAPDAGEIDITGAALIDINAGANLDIDVTGTFDMLATTTFSIDGTGASNVSATSGNLTIETITSGTLILKTTTAGDIDITSAATLDIGCVGFELDATGTVSIDGVGASNFTIDTGSLSLITTTSGAIILNSAGAITVTNAATMTISGDLTVSGSFSAGAMLLDSVIAATTDGSLTLDGDGTGGVILGGGSATGAVSCNEAFNLAASQIMTLAGVEGSNIFVMTLGDAVISQGSLAITDNDDAAALVIVNNTITTGSLVTLTSSTSNSGSMLNITNTDAAVSGNIVSVVADGVTSGTMLYLETSDAAMAGLYINCYDGAATDFSVGVDGRIVIAGDAAVDAVTVTAGHVQITLGDIDLDEGKIQVNTTVDETSHVIRNLTGATTSIVEIEATHTGDTGPCLELDHDGTGAVDVLVITSASASAGSAIKVTHAGATGTILEGIAAASTTTSMVSLDGTTGAGWIGAANVGLVHLTSDGALADVAASCLYIGYSGAGIASGNGSSIRVIDTGGDSTASAVYLDAATGIALEVNGQAAVDTCIITSAAAAASALKITTSTATGTCYEAVCAASTTVSMVTIDGSTGNWIGAANVGMVNLACDGALADANASCLYIAYSGTGAATGLGTSIRVNDSGATATSSAVYITAASAAQPLHLVGSVTAIIKVEGTATSVLHIMDANTNLVKFNASGDGGVTVGADNMFKDPHTDDEAGHITVDVAGTSYQMPIYAEV